MMYLKLFSAALLCTSILTGCENHSNARPEIEQTRQSSESQQPKMQPDDQWVQGQFELSSTYFNKCAAPRSGIDPFTGKPYSDQPGTVLDEKLFVRSLLHEYYLWYSELVDTDPSQYQTVEAYYDSMLPSRDRFSGVTPYDDFRKFYEQGTQFDYGIKWRDAVDETGELDFYVYFVEPGSANDKLVTRGDKLVSLNGLTLDDALTTQEARDVFLRYLQPDESSESVSAVFLTPAQQQITVELTAGTVQYRPVPVAETLATNDGLVGYILFETHNFIAQDDLYNAISTFQVEGVSDLIVDLRHNGGGILSAANQFAYMVAGPASTEGKIFRKQRFNDKFGNFSAITGEPNTGFGFIDSLLDDNNNRTDETLPSLNLDRVFVLTSQSTCSASEAFMNGLQGIGVEVIQIGSTTCGKPYVNIPIENCGKVYNFLTAQGVNEQGFGSYEDGFSPRNGLVFGGLDTLPGCKAFDDFTTPFADPTEPLLAAALHYREFGQCPATNASRPLSEAFGSGLLGNKPTLFSAPNGKLLYPKAAQ